MQLRHLILKLIIFLSAYYLSLTFIAASLDKIIDPLTFSKMISNYDITPYWTNNFVALILPWLELICGLILFFGILYNNNTNKNDKNIFFQYQEVANNIIILMLVWFIFILTIAIVRGLDIDCGCGLSETKTLPIIKLKEDIYLLILSFIIKFRFKIINFFKINTI
jgi:putative oxidoreductase